MKLSAFSGVGSSRASGRSDFRFLARARLRHQPNGDSSCELTLGPAERGRSASIKQLVCDPASVVQQCYGLLRSVTVASVAMVVVRIPRFGMSFSEATA